MKKLLGGAVLVAGVVGTGWYGTANNAKTMQAEVTSAVTGANQGTVHPIDTRVSGRDIFVSGTADTEAERDQILSMFNDVNGRRVVRDDLNVLEMAGPFTFNAENNADGSSYSGMIPTEADRATIADRIGDGAGDLDLMAGAPDTNWTGVVGQGLNSLDALEDGTLSVVDNVITVSGTAMTPDEDAAARAALAELPEGYSADFDITVLDDGTPFRLTMHLGEDGAVTSTGKIPATLEAADLSAALGSDVGADIQQSILPPNLADWSGASKLGASALGELRSGQLQMVEDTLSVTGVATPDGKAAAEALLANVPNGFTATSDISLYDDGTPFTLEMVSNGDGTTAMGKFPADVAVGDIIGDVSPDDIRTAFIGDETAGFGTVATGGVNALAQLEEGKLSVVGTDVTLTGIALTPTQAGAAMDLLGDLPDGYNANFDIETIDDGTPPNFDVTYTAADGATVDGKLPAGTQVEDIAAALNLSAVSGDPVQGLVGDGALATEKLTAVAGWLPELDSMTFNSNDTAVTVDAIAAPGADRDLVLAGLSDALGDGVSVSVTAATEMPDEGASRTNQATGRAEAFTSGYWLPVFDFAPDADTCNAQSADALQADRINFVTGSAQLDAQSVRAINAVAAIVRKCLADTDLNVEIGGHTDSQSGEGLNQELSSARADAVRAALIARGASDGAIFAKGYGEAEPIADNETAEGRAANRRTTITWFTPVVEEVAVETEETGASEHDADTQVDTEVGE